MWGSTDTTSVLHNGGVVFSSRAWPRARWFPGPPGLRRPWGLFRSNCSACPPWSTSRQARRCDAMAHRIVILGGGTGGTLVANRLQRHYGQQAHITGIDRDDSHLSRPGLLFVPFGLAEPSEIVRPRHAQLRHGIHFRLAEAHSVDSAQNTVHLNDGTEVPYDVLLIATGASLQPEETEGLSGPEEPSRTRSTACAWPWPATAPPWWRGSAAQVPPPSGGPATTTARCGSTASAWTSPARMPAPRSR